MNFFLKLNQFLNTSSILLGLNESVNLFIQSDMGYLVRQNRSDRTKSLQNNYELNYLIELLQQHVGSSGVLLYPGFFDEYSRSNVPFDVKSSQPSKHIGALPKFVFNTLTTSRELNPLTNIMATGENRGVFFENNGKDTTGYSQKSVWSQFSEKLVSILLIGVPPSYLTYIHFLEVQSRAPYIFNKVFNLPILSSGIEISSFSICPVRLRDSSIRWNFTNFINLCVERQAICLLPGSNGFVSLTNPQRLKDLFDEQFCLNPFFLLDTSLSNYLGLQKNLESSLDMKALPNIHGEFLS
jgi:aminoglycoside N3'-acetyltransferase